MLIYNQSSKSKAVQYTNYASFPTNAISGSIAIDQETDTLYYFNSDSNSWVSIAGGTGGSGETITVSDTNTIDLAKSGGVISASLKVENASAGDGYKSVTITDSSSGISAKIASSDILASVQTELDTLQTNIDAKASQSSLDTLQTQVDAIITESTSVTDSNSIDLSITGNAISGNVKLSTDSAVSGNKKIDLSIKSDGLFGSIGDSLIVSAVQSELDTLQSNIDTKADSSDLTSHLNDSADAHDASAISVVAISGVTGDNAQSVLENLKTQIDLKLESSDLSTIETNITSLQSDVSSLQSDLSAINQEATTVSDSNSIDLTLTGNEISGSVKLSSATASANNKLVNLSIETDGLKAQITDSNILSAVQSSLDSKADQSSLDTLQTQVDAIITESTAVSDTNSIDLTLVSNTITADVKLSSAIADGGKFLANADIQSDGLRIQINESDINTLIGNYSAIDNSNISSSASINFSKMENLTASRVLVSNVDGDVSASSVTSTTLGYLDISSSLQITLDSKLELSDLSTIESNITTLQSDVSNIQTDLSAIVEESTTVSNSNSINLSLTGHDISASLNLSGENAGANKFKADTSIETDGLLVQVPNSHIESIIDSYTNIDNANISSSAGINFSKMENLTASKVLVSNVNGDVSASSISTTTLDYLDATSSIQSQLDSKQSTITGGASSIVSSNLTATKVLVSDSSGKVSASSISDTTLGYLDATSSIQTQLDSKASLTNLSDHESDTTSIHGIADTSLLVTTTGTQTLTNKTLTSPSINGGITNFGTASDNNKLVIPKASTTVLDALTNTEASLAYDETLQALVFNDGLTGWNQITSGSGSGGSYTVADTSSIDMTLNGASNTEISADLKISSSIADSGKFLVGLDIQTDGLRAQVTNTSVESIIDSYTNIDNANISSSAGINFSKMENLTASRVLVSNVDGDVSASSITSTTLGYLDATSSIQTQLDSKQTTITGGASSIVSSNLTASKVLISDSSGKVSASSISDTTLGYLDATSSIQTQLDSKQSTITGGASSIVSSNLTASKVLISDSSGKVSASSISNTTLGYLDATSSIQTQLDSKQASGTYVTPTGSVTLQNKTLDNSNAITVIDSNLTIQDNADNTKQVKFEVSGVTTGTTRTLTIPNSNGTLIVSGTISDSDVSSSASIALSKLATVTANRALISNSSGNISVASVTDTELGYLSGITATPITKENNIVTESTTARTLALTDAWKYIRTTNSSATTITIPPNSSVAFSIGTQIDFFQAGAGQVAFAAGAGVTISYYTGLKISAQYQAATIIKTGTDTWDLIGPLAA